MSLWNSNTSSEHLKIVLAIKKVALINGAKQPLVVRKPGRVKFISYPDIEKEIAIFYKKQLGKNY